MKKILLLTVLVFSLISLYGCGKVVVESSEEEGITKSETTDLEKDQDGNEASESEESKYEHEDNTSESLDTDKYIDYKGEYKLKVEGYEDLYLITSLEIYYGYTGITIEAIDNNLVKGTISSIQGAPSYRQAIVEFEGEIIDDKLVASYADDAWEYSGDIELIFENNMILAKITRNEQDSPSMWGIPEGEFEFVRPIATEKIILTADEKNKLEDFLFPLSRNNIKPFNEGELTDDMIINYVGMNIALGNFNINEFGDKIKENGGTIVFDETLMNDLSKKYFGVEIKEHKSFDICTYINGSYEVPALGGVSEYPVVQLMLKDINNENIYYAIVDYMFDYPEGGKALEYQYIIKLEKINNDEYVIKYIKNIEFPIDFEIFNEL